MVKKAKAKSALSPQAWKQLRKLERADVLVGVPSYNNAHTINYVVYQAAQGLAANFSGLRSAIFISDGNSTDGTLESVQAMRLPFPTRLIFATYLGLPGKGSAVKAIFEAARFLDAQAVALIDSDLRSITSDWIRLLLAPTLNGFGLVSPFYVRHKYDGTITNFLCYPLTTSLYGKKIRQPIGGDFGLSIELVHTLLESPLWRFPFVQRFGIDIFETQTALAGGFEVTQAFLGQKIHEAKDPSKHLAPMFSQVAASLFTCTKRYQEVWKNIRGCRNVRMVGEQTHVGEPEAVHIDARTLLSAYRKGISEHRRVYKAVLSQELCDEVDGLKNADRLEVVFSPERWAKIVYSFCGSFNNEKRFAKEVLLDAFRLLWIGKVAAFVHETGELDTRTAERKIEKEVETFEALKPYLLDIF